MSTPSTAPLPLPDAPYRGIKPFGFIDQQIFSARGKEIWELVSNITLYRAFMLYGDSGTGKSSLINAGLMPQMHAENYVLDRVHVQPFAGREIRVERMAARGGEQPPYLPSNFTAPDAETRGALTADDAEGFELSLEEFKQQLKRFGSHEPKVSDAEELFGLDQSKPGPLLVFDQFEEFITLFEEPQQEGGSTLDPGAAAQHGLEVQRSILQVLVELIQDKSLALNLILVFREDYLAKLSSLFKACPELQDRSQRLLPPAIDSLVRIIRAPFKNPVLRAHFLQQEDTERPGTELTESLASRVAGALGRRSEVYGVNLTELQIVCLSLWQSSDPEALFEKGIEEILSDYVAGVFGSLEVEFHSEAEELLSQMITSSNTRNIVSENDLLAGSEHTHLSLEQRRKILESFRSTQLVRRERRRDLVFYELSSEYFVPWIKTRVAEREAREVRRALVERRARAMREWRRARRSKRLVRAFGFLLIALLGLGIVVGFLYKKSVETQRKLVLTETDRRTAQATAEAAQRQNTIYEAAIKAIGAKDDKEKLRVFAQMKQWAKEGDLPPNLPLLLVAAQTATENPEVKRAALELLALAVKTEPNLSQSIGAFAESAPSLAEKFPRFYIHFADDNQRGLAQKMSTTLREQGWVVPVIQKGGGDAPKWDYELRYFRKNEEGMPVAQDILALLDQTTGIKWVDAYNPRYGNSPKIRPGHFELWFPAPTGLLLVSFADEENQPLHGLKPIISFEPIGGVGIRFKRKRAGIISVPPGNYDVTITVKGYKELHLPLSMEIDGRVEWTLLKLTRDDSQD